MMGVLMCRVIICRVLRMGGRASQRLPKPRAPGLSNAVPPEAGRPPTLGGAPVALRQRFGLRRRQLHQRVERDAVAEQPEPLGRPQPGESSEESRVGKEWWR